MTIDYLILGSGLSVLTFAALMAKQGRKVLILEAHEFPGGFCHTFKAENKNYSYHFNAQLHYVWDCGEGETVNRVLKKLNLDKNIPFVQYDPNGFDHMQIPGHTVKIPSNYPLLIERLTQLFPIHAKAINNFLMTCQNLATIANQFSKPSQGARIKHFFRSIKKLSLLRFYGKTLQQVFDYFLIPKPAQSLLASQWPDFLLPPKDLSFYCWLILFDGYMRGAYYPKNHFEHVINSLVNTIQENGGEIRYNERVSQIHAHDGKITSVTAINTNHPETTTEYNGTTVICNIDPKKASQMIGLQHFSSKVKKQLEYDYSYSNFVVYGAVEGIDLRDYGFGNWNIFHSEQEDLNQCVDEMYFNNNYSKPSFAITTPSLVTDDPTGCPAGHQIFQLLTVANYDHFKHYKLRNQKEYLYYKKNIYHSMLDAIEKNYVPNFRDHICFHMLGSPTTNKSYCGAPEGHSYGSNMTPANTRIFQRLGAESSLKNLYFCNASAGFAGFTMSFKNGGRLYEKLAQDVIPIDV